MLTSFLMSSQSESMTSSKPSSPRRTSVSRYLFTCPGMPFTSPEFTITESAPAVTPAAKDGRSLLAHRDVGDQRGRAIAPARRQAVADVMLLRRGDALRRRRVGALVAAHRGHAHHARQVCILAECLVEPRPQRLAADVDDGREVPAERRRRASRRRRCGRKFVLLKKLKMSHRNCNLTPLRAASEVLVERQVGLEVSRTVGSRRVPRGADRAELEAVQRVAAGLMICSFGSPSGAARLARDAVGPLIVGVAGARRSAVQARRKFAGEDRQRLTGAGADDGADPPSRRTACRIAP